jgi:hypothetical protein
MMKYKNVTYPVINATECKSAQLIAFALGYLWDYPRNCVVRTVEPLKWLGFDPDTLTIRVYDRDYAVDKAFIQAVNLCQLTECLSNPVKVPSKKNNLPTGRPFAIVSFGYPHGANKIPRTRVVRLQSLDDDYLTGYEISDVDDPDTGVFKSFSVDKLLSDVVVYRQDVS